MSEAVKRLLEHATTDLGPQVPIEHTKHRLDAFGELGKELGELLTLRAGWYAFESALLVRPIVDAGPVKGILTWNEPELWRSAYPQFPEMCVFAEDVFGNPFAIVEAGVVQIDAETGECDPFADSINAWAQRILNEKELSTGWPLANQWQDRKGSLPLGTRLLPRTPFVLGGDYVVENLVLANDLDGMHARAKLATQLATLPPGSDVTYELRVAKPLQ